MVKLDKGTLKRVRAGVGLTDSGDVFGEEFYKLQAIANIIAASNADDGTLDLDETRLGLGYVLTDIKENLKNGLDHLEKQIKAEMPVIQFAKDALDRIEEGHKHDA